MALVVLFILAGCSGASSPTPLVDKPRSEADKLAASLLLRPDDVPDGYRVGRLVTTASERPLPECAGYAEMDRKYGAAESHWGITYEWRGRHELAWINEVVAVWPTPVAEERAKDVLAFAPACFAARVSANSQENIKDKPLLAFVSSSIQPFTPPAGAAGGFRVALVVREAGIEFTTYYDFVFMPRDRATVVLEFHRLAEPPDPALVKGVLEVLADRLPPL